GHGGGRLEGLMRVTVGHRAVGDRGQRRRRFEALARRGRPRVHQRGRSAGWRLGGESRRRRRFGGGARARRLQVRDGGPGGGDELAHLLLHLGSLGRGRGGGGWGGRGV